VFAGLLARRDDPQHMAQLEEHGIPCIDLIACNLYPFARVVAKPDVLLEEALENIDIGGVTLIRAAAKNYRDVAVLTDPGQYGGIAELLKGKGGIDEGASWELAKEAFRHVLRYDEAISDFFERYRDPAGNS
jgi:phosphoribosylaminoimidazolecarboxamide formyltransferase/IMP cyclohydrolase